MGSPLCIVCVLILAMIRRGTYGAHVLGSDRGLVWPGGVARGNFAIAWSLPRGLMSSADAAEMQRCRLGCYLVGAPGVAVALDEIVSWSRLT
jgi:hypothetical protein